jgi:UPF0755 protein
MRSLWRVLKFSLLAVLLGAVALAGWLTYFAVTPVDVPSQATELVIAQGRPLKGVARDLVRRGVLREPWSFEWMARLLGLANDLKAGSYELPNRITPYGLLEKVARGDVTQVSITFIEGWTFKQLRSALDAHPGCRHDTRDLSETQILQQLGAQEAQAEGLFFPDTYYFASGASDLTILARARHTMQQRLADLWQARAQGLPYNSPYEALIMASIVEKETGLESERDMIAAVFVNRLKRDMRLQTDPSVIYGIGERFDGNLRRQDLETDTPYNTYTRGGLPPTPIALPGQRALEAAMRPAPSAALYFVARGDGSSQFSASLEEHNRAVQRYQLKR